MNVKSVLKKVLIFAGILFCLYGVAVIFSVSGRHWFNFAELIIGAVLILDGAFIDKLATLNKKLPKIVSGVIIALLCAVLIHFAGFEINVISFANSKPDAAADWMIVLGAKVNGQTPSLEFKKRLDAAALYAKENDDVKIILTGGMGSDETTAESAVAFEYLKSCGVSEDRLYREEKSTSTAENFLYAKEIIIAAEGIDGGKTAAAVGFDDEKILIVSSSFHLYRASILAKHCGYQNNQYLGSMGMKILLPHYCIREYAAYIREAAFL